MVATLTVAANRPAAVTDHDPHGSRPDPAGSTGGIFALLLDHHTKRARRRQSGPQSEP